MFLSATLTVSLLTQTATTVGTHGLSTEKNRNLEQKSIGFEINADDAPSLTEEEVIQAVKAAASSGAETYMVRTLVQYDGTSKKTGADLSDEIHLVSFDTTWNQDPSLLAVTHVWSNANNEIVHFDIEINADDVYWSTTGDPNKHDLHNTMTHEFGHALGLEHSDETQTLVCRVPHRLVNSPNEMCMRMTSRASYLSILFKKIMIQSDPTDPTEDEGNEPSGGNSGVDNALVPSAGGGGGNMRTTSVSKGWMLSQSTDFTFDR